MSFSLHQRRHREEARKRGRVDGEGREEERDVENGGKAEAEFNKRRKKRLALPVDPETRIAKLRTLRSARRKRRRQEGRLAAVAGEDGESFESLRDGAVRAVTALLAATNEERSRRGKYARYRPERRDEIAEFALEHGVSEACGHFRDDSGSNIVGSTVRFWSKEGGGGGVISPVTVRLQVLIFFFLCAGTLSSRTGLTRKI